MNNQPELFKRHSDHESSALFSPCKSYRFMLLRKWDNSKPLVMFIGLNPSTANESEDDATIRRVVSMAKQWGFGGVYMMNCFAYVSTNPDDLKDFSNNDINDKCLMEIGKLCKEIIFAWGAFEIARERGEQLCKMFPDASALILNKDGSPRHPLYVPANVQRVKYKNIEIEKQHSTSAIDQVSRG